MCFPHWCSHYFWLWGCYQNTRYWGQEPTFSLHPFSAMGSVLPVSSNSLESVWLPWVPAPCLEHLAWSGTEGSPCTTAHVGEGLALVRSCSDCSWRAQLYGKKSCLRRHFPSCLWSERLGLPSHLSLTLQSMPDTSGGDNTTEKKQVLGDGSFPSWSKHTSSQRGGLHIGIWRYFSSAFCQKTWGLPEHCTSGAFRGPGTITVLEAIVLFA